jgi:hypothetical protein
MAMEWLTGTAFLMALQMRSTSVLEGSAIMARSCRTYGALARVAETVRLPTASIFLSKAMAAGLLEVVMTWQYALVVCLRL